MDAFVTDDAVLLDDGVFYIQTQPGTGLAAGFLQRRCYFGVTTPGGFECVGSFTRQGQLWRARIDAPYDQLTDEDSRTIGLYRDRVSAVVCLWRYRHMALCRHLDEVVDQGANFVGRKLLFKMLVPEQQSEVRWRFVDADPTDGFIYEIDAVGGVLCRRRIPELIGHAVGG